MRAMRLRAPAPIEEKPLLLEQTPMPEPGPGQIRLRVKACAVCHTDLHIVEGELQPPRLPLTPGHQIVGEVDALGPDLSPDRRADLAENRFRIGDRAGAAWLAAVCGECGHCRAGRENLCDASRFTGLHIDGGYAEYAIAEARFAYRIPEGFSAESAAPLLCAGIIGYRALRLSGIEPGGRLGLWGFGASAHVAIQIARHWGCEIAVVSRSASHRRQALELGAAWAGGAGQRPPFELDAAVNFTPAGATVPEGIAALRKGGTLALAGIHMSDLPAMPYALLYGERAVRSVANSQRRDGDELLQLAAAIPIRPRVELFALEQANEALARVKSSSIDGAAALVP
ncbi:MAG: Alcohol dehydrogenase [candidate division BRC1 bacterium ADurb.BinA364]|nr:MAG: Alcohol dehydrogenase [candidate division BRC1 bacterium ADurb.BinA364]